MDLWCQGCPKSPEWEGELELGSADEDEEEDNAGSADENEDERLEDYLKQVIQSPLWVLVRDFFSSADVLEMRTTEHKCNVVQGFSVLFPNSGSFSWKKMKMTDLSSSQSRPA